MKIIIDSNIFIGLYESNKDPLSIFNDIEKIKSNLIIPQQIIDEVIRNRDDRLLYLRALIDTQKFPAFSTSLIKDLKGFSKLKPIKGQFTRVKNLLTAQIDEMIEDPKKDPIFNSFLKLITDSSVTILPINEELIKRSHIRKLKGNPPKNEKDNKIGDEIIWESILSNIQDNVILVSRDLTYSSHKTFLTREFKQKTGKKITFSEKISDALISVGEDVSPELKQFEKEQQIALHSDRLYKLTESGSAFRDLVIGGSMAEMGKLIPLSLADASIGERYKLVPLSLAEASIGERYKHVPLSFSEANIDDWIKTGLRPFEPKDKKEKTKKTDASL